MSVKVSTKVWEWSKAEGNARLVMLALADFCDDDGYCYPGIARIAFKCRLSERTVQRAVAEMVEKGEIVVSRAGVKVGAGITNRYHLIITKGCQSVTPTDEGVTKHAERGDTADRKGCHVLSPKSSVPVSTRKGVRSRPMEKPSVGECEAEAVRQGLPKDEGAAFWAYHESSGWLVGRKPMSNWRAAMITWKKNHARFAASDAGKGGGRSCDGKAVKRAPRAAEAFWRQELRGILKHFDAKIDKGPYAGVEFAILRQLRTVFDHAKDDSADVRKEAEKMIDKCNYPLDVKEAFALHSEGME